MSQPKISSCITADETRSAYLELVSSRVCGDGVPCLHDECEHCGPVMALVDQRSDECEARGCTINRCVFDPGPLQ